jgi:hypothetical protein
MSSRRAAIARQRAYAERVIPPSVAGRTLRIEAITIACGGDLGQEMEVFLGQVAFWAPHLPVFLLTDKAGARRAKSLKSPLDLTIEILSSEELTVLGESAMIPEPYMQRWSKPWIGAKLEALRRAVALWPGRGVLLCDSDLVLDGRITELIWADCHAVFSKHVGPHCLPMVSPDVFGHYNAGLLLTDQPGLVERWIEMYRMGVVGFFEQKALEHLSREWVVDTFPATWNWGMWRARAEDINETGRRPAILHAHIVGPLADQSNLDAHIAVATAARRAVERVTTSHPLKDHAFIHFAKAGGTTMQHHLGEVARERGYQFHDSWGTGRDWDNNELKRILEGTSYGHLKWRNIVHNHAQNWNRYLLQIARYNGYVTFALWRPVKDRLVSFHHWSRQEKAAGRLGLTGPAGAAKNINEFLTYFLDLTVYQVDWCLPEWHDLISHWYPATSEGVQRCIKDRFNLDITPEHLNRSVSNGWDAAVSAGELSSDIITKVNSDPRVIAWEAFTTQLTLKI